MARRASTKSPDSYKARRERAASALLSDGWQELHPYHKWRGAHWRLVSLVDLSVHDDPRQLAMLEQVLAWLHSTAHTTLIREIKGRVRRCASQEGNALRVAVALGQAGDPRVRRLAEDLSRWQWPDGGWNCDVNSAAHHSSFHESWEPILGLTSYATATGDAAAKAAAQRGGRLLLDHRLYKSSRSGEVIRPQWLNIHWPPYWHYDFFQGLLALAGLGLLEEPGADDGIDLLESKRLTDGTWKPTGRRWWTIDKRGAEVVDWRGLDALHVTRKAEEILRLAGGA